MFDSNTLKKSIWAIIKNLEILRFAHDHLKAEKIAVKCSCVKMQLKSCHL